MSNIIITIDSCSLAGKSLMFAVNANVDDGYGGNIIIDIHIDTPVDQINTELKSRTVDKMIADNMIKSASQVFLIGWVS